MELKHQTADGALLEELGRRLRDARLEQNLSQKALADRAGIGRVTLQRMEAGDSPSLINFVRVLRALDLLEGFDLLLPEAAPSPIDEVERRGRRRQRASSSRNAAAKPQPRIWRWADEET